MSHAESTHPFSRRRGGSATALAASFFARLARGWRFAVETIIEARTMEMEYRRKNRRSYHDW
jgi:hypothetical protein